VLIEEGYRAKMHASVNAATPLMVGKDRVFLSACYDVGAAVWEIDPGAGSKRDLWARGDVLDAHYATPVLVGGKLYGFHGRQETGQELRCIDLLTGKVLWSEAFPTGSVIASGNQLVILTEKGELVLAPADPKVFKPSARGQILGATTRAIPALADSHLYARDSKRLVCVDLSE
jgi:outer membrane protein assembly factor BamB